jgi:predicted RND superfamily exporter protein
VNLAEVLTRLSLRYPGPTLAVVAVVTVLLGLGATRIERETALRTFLGADHPTVLALDRHLERFGGGYPVIVAYSCDDPAPCSSVFDPAAIQMADRIDSELQQTPGIRAVHSLARTPLIVAEGDDLRVVRFAELDGNGATREALALSAAADPLWQRALVSEDGKVGAIVIDLSSSQTDIQQTVATELERILAPHRANGWNFHLVGELVDFVYTGPELERASAALIPVMTVVLMGLLWILLRSLALSVAIVAAMGIDTLWTQGAMGWVGIALNAVTTVVPSVVFAIGILDGVHLGAHYKKRCWEHGAPDRETRRQILLEVSRDVGPPCVLNSLTIIGAFLSFLFAGFAAITEFGVACAFGIATAFVLTFTVVPIALAWMPAGWLRAERAEPAWDELLRSAISLVNRKSRPILAVTLLFGAIGLAGVAQLDIEIRPEQLVGETNQVMIWNRWLREHLRDTETLELALTLPAGSSFRDPAVLTRVEDLKRWLEEQDRVGHPRSVTDPLRHINRLLHDGDSTYDRFEPEPAHNGQLAMLLSLHDPDALPRWIFAETNSTSGEMRETLRVAAEAETMSTSAQRALLRSVHDHLEGALPSDWSYELTGSIPMYYDMMAALQRYQLLCFGIAGVPIYVLMTVFLRSPRIALLALLPSLLPIAVTLGLLGWWDYGLDPASTMVATIVLGVGVDDSIHMLSRYREQRLGGHALEESVSASLMHVGRPVIVSALVLSAAFWSLTVSPMTSVASFGFLAGLAILIALAADLLVLPALLMTRWLGDPYR